MTFNEMSIFIGQKKNFQEWKGSFGEQGAYRSISKMSPGINIRLFFNICTSKYS